MDSAVEPSTRRRAEQFPKTWDGLRGFRQNALKYIQCTVHIYRELLTPHSTMPKQFPPLPDRPSIALPLSLTGQLIDAGWALISVAVFPEFRDMYRLAPLGLRAISWS